MGHAEAVAVPEPLSARAVYGVVRRYYPTLWSDPERRDDAAAEGWIAMEAARRSFDPARYRSFPGYAVTRIRFRLLDWLRTERGGRGRRPVFVPHDALPVPITTAFPEDRILERIDNERAWACWSDREQHAALRLASGYTTPEIGAEWGVTKQAVSKVIAKARRKVASLSPAGVSP